MVINFFTKKYNIEFMNKIAKKLKKQRKKLGKEIKKRRKVIQSKNLYWKTSFDGRRYQDKWYLLYKTNQDLSLIIDKIENCK